MTPATGILLIIPRITTLRGRFRRVVAITVHGGSCGAAPGAPTPASRARGPRALGSPAAVHLSPVHRGLGRPTAVPVPGRSRGGGLRRPLPALGPLRRIKRRIEAVLGQQLVVGSLLDDSPAVDDQNPVGAADSRETMGDDERRPALRQLVKRVENHVLGPRVDGGGRLVEDQDGRVLQEGARHADPLPFSEGYLRAALAEPGLVALSAGGR